METRKKTVDAEWEIQLRKFDETGALARLQKNRKQIIQDAVEGKTAVRISEHPKYGVLHEYDGVHQTEFEGWPVSLGSLAVGVRTPEYVARSLSLDPEIVRRDWGDVREIKKCGGLVTVHLAAIDKKRTLCVQSQECIGASYGTFLGIDQKNRPNWPNVKFDFHSAPLGAPQLFEGDLYSYVRNLIKLSQECDVGIETKDLHHVVIDEPTLGGRLFFPEFLHIYPRFEMDTPPEEQKRILGKVYDVGKQYWGDAFTINKFSDGLTGKGPLHEHLRNISRD